MQKGAKALSNAELLAILIAKGRKGINAVALAQEWLKQSQGLTKLLTTPYSELRQLHGMGMATFCQLQASLELQRRYLEEHLQQVSTTLNSSETVKRFLIAKLRHLDHEAFACLFLNTHHQLIEFEILFHGTVSRAYVHPREVVKRALYHNAHAVIAAHNHPSGINQPSHSDKALTQTLKESLTLLDIQLLDHIIIGSGGVEAPFSFAEMGLL